MSKFAQKINFTHLLKLFLKEHYSIMHVDSDKIILQNFGMNINSPLRIHKKFKRYIKNPNFFPLSRL